MVEDKTDVDVARALGANERLDGYLHHAYSLAWTPAGSGLDVTPIDATAAVDAMRVTAKDFGVFDRHLANRNVDRLREELATLVPFVRITGKSDPKALAQHLAMSTPR